MLRVLFLGTVACSVSEVEFDLLRTSNRCYRKGFQAAVLVGYRLTQSILGLSVIEYF